jgi:hypothetical protein
LTVLDRDLRLLGIASAGAAIAAAGPEIAARAVAGGHEKNKDEIPLGRRVLDPAFSAILDEAGIDPNKLWYPPIDALPGEYTLDELVKWSQKSAREGLAEWLPAGKGTDRGAMEVELVNSFVEELFPVLSDEGAEWSYSLGPDQKLIHDILSEDLVCPDGLSEDEQLVWCADRLAEYRERG